MAGGYVDCHCHMTADEFAQDTADILERSRKAGVQALVSVTEHAGELESLLRLSERYPNYVMPCFGVHPIQSKAEGYRSVTLQDLEPALEKFEKYKDHLVGIGEIGLDFTPWLTPTAKEREEQLKVFQMQLDIAKQLDLPVNVHSRSAGRQTMAFLKEQGAQKVLLHNFAGRPSVALEGAQAGYFFSFPPAVANNDQERNIPANIFIPCEYIARVKGLSSEKVCEVTAHNAFRLFPKIRHRLNNESIDSPSLG
ncbi:putative deoxyribonuclease tatdn3-A isoform X2 [Bufo gargarizans]|uniref:putative deoxyribonuclease tatdn3-A isoform X2 n=1 Tax=Bufo gargarizans TaxID=30331 RepID=UPI001CF5EA0E|nr:putative deoxyribonuclease tatdn3-A isoform X2 [Bufo gargarizans]